MFSSPNTNKTSFPRNRYGNTISSTSNSVKMFTIFPNLPSELRIKIWQQACYPRIVTLTYTTATSSFTSTTPPPTLLSVNHESRHEALRIYTLCFGTSSQPPRTYFNPFLDTLYLPRHQEMGYDETLREFRQLVHDPTCLLDQVRYVAIDHVNVDVKRPWESYNKAVFLRSFKHLDEIALILNADGTGAGDISDATPNEHQQLTGVQKASQGKLIFEELRIDPERLLKIWYYFRQSFMIEEHLLEDVCRDSGREYEAFELPTVRILAKGFEDAGAANQSKDGLKAGNHMQAALDMMRS
ncbi:hypothetical protein BKA64DRAFT_180272 [Cadophora sp. MPI-SDFR-AT-0126]|nr:hypothetical protein BKA64DRAFT_180272 [Leotiomycetes sp. MPI-SDFR-AT-0126]